MKMMMTFMTLILLATSSMASDGENGKKKFEEIKARVLSHLDTKIKMMEENKVCINAAKDKTSLRACRKSAKEKMQAFKKQNQEKRKKFREERKARRAAKKKSDS